MDAGRRRHTLMTEMDGKAMIEISNAIAQLTNPGAFDAPLSGSPSTTPDPDE